MVSYPNHTAPGQASQRWFTNTNNNEKFRSFKSRENIHKKEVGPYRGFGY